MNKFFSAIVIILVFMVTLSCNKEKNEVDYHWKETWCANPWNNDSDNTQAEVKAIVIEYLASEKVKVKEVMIVFNESQAELCEACTCLSGNNIIVTIDDRFEKKLGALGFEEYE
ncbi:MAG: hypothetical protein ACI8ZM_000367 [Crocinitomix sp.]|jgi:hypothetical protein